VRPPHEWEDGLEGRTLAAAPEHLLRVPSRDGQGRPAGPVADEISQGRRRKTLLSIAGTLRRRGLTGDEIAVALFAVNTKRCRPMLLEEEILELARDVADRYEPEPPDPEQERIDRMAEELLEGEPAGQTPREDEPPPRAPRGEKTSGSSSRSSWEEPVPLKQRGSPPPFPIETLFDWTASWAMAISAEKGATVDLGASLALDVVAGAIARNVQVSPRPGWYEPTNLYTIVALAPGQRKTPVFKAALRPVRTLERQLMRGWEEQQQLVTISDAIFDKRRKELINEAADDDELDPERLRERVDELVEGLETVTSARPRLLTEDVTPEGLAGLLADHGRIIAASDEGASLFENLAGRYAHGSTSWDILNKGHSSADLVVDRKSSGPVIVFDPTITLAIATQPEMLRTLASKPGAEGRGVLARPLYVLPAPVYVQGPTPAAEPALLDEYARRIRNVYSDTPELEFDDDDHPRPTFLTFAVDARGTFERFEAELNRERRELGGDDLDGDSVYLGWLSKLAGQTARLAAVLHAADHWSAGTGAAAVVIDESTVERAIALARYYRTHALAVFGLIGELPEQRRAQSILGWLRTRSPEELEVLTIRDVQRSRGTGTKVENVRVALRLLEEHGYVRLERPMAGKRGRPPERVLVHPEIENPRDRPDKSDRNSGSAADPANSVASVAPDQGISDSPELVQHRDPACHETRRWKARDGVWRCAGCEPYHFPGEVLEEHDA